MAAQLKEVTLTVRRIPKNSCKKHLRECIKHVFVSWANKT